MAAPLRTLVLTCALSSFMTGAVAAQPAPLPHAPAAMIAAVPGPREVTERLARGDATATQCRVELGILRCSCLRTAGASFGSWSRGEVAGYVATAVDGTDLFYAASGLEVDGMWVFEDVRIAFGDVLLVAAQLQAFGGTAQMRDIRWTRYEGEPPMSCGQAPAPGPTFARARAATWTPANGWRLQGLRAGAAPLSFAGSAHRAAPGLLPPRVRASDDAVDVEVAVAALKHAFVHASAGAHAPAMFGVGVVSSRRGTESAALRLGASASRTTAKPAAFGDVGFGRASHVRAHLEHPLDDELWHLRRLETGALWRDWRASQVGLSAAGDAHALQLLGTVTTTPDTPNAAWTGRLAFGTDIHTSRHALWTLDAAHDSDRLDGTRHSTTAALGLRTPFGWRERLWLQPGVDLIANYAAVTVDRGFDASTTLLALGSVEAGIALLGVHGNARHRLAPIVRAGAELTGTQQRQEREGAPPYPFDRPERWRWVQVLLEQSWRKGPVRLEIPVGVFADWREGGATLRGFARGTALVGDARVEAAVICRDDCDRAAFYTAGRVAPRAGVELEYGVADVDEVEVGHLHADELARTGLTTLRLYRVSTDTPTTAHHAALRVRRGAMWGAVHGRYGADPSGRGATVGAGWSSPLLGWGVAAEGGVLQDGTWAVSAGLRLGR